MKNIYNQTRREIKNYCLYTTSDFGTIKGVGIKLTVGNEELDMDIDSIEKNYGVQKTPFTFVKTLKPGGKIEQIKIKMRMQNAFDFRHQEIVILYPRNYGSKVEHMKVTYITRGMECLNIKLHVIKRKHRGYVDEPLRACVPKKEGNMINYTFLLDKDEINVNNLYYLRIVSKDVDDDMII